MSFSEQTWRTRASANLVNFQQWLKKGDAPYIVYSTVAGLTIWPLIEAVVKTGQWETGLVALYSVAGGMGANLVAEQLQRWRDQAQKKETVMEADVVDWIAREVPNQTELRQAVDAIITHFEAIPQLHKEMNGADWQPIATALRKELQKLGTLETFAPIINSTVAMGDQSVAVGGDVNAPIMTGAQATYIAQLVQAPTHESATLPPNLQAYLFNLYNLITRYFNVEELHTLCFDLNVEFEDLPGEGRSVKARELVYYLDRQQRIPELVKRLEEVRPTVQWPVFYPVDDGAKAPFKGMDFFDEKDADLFFGREQLTAQLVGYLREHRFLAVIGASGSGKSSVVRAGMIRTLRHGKQLEGRVLPPKDSENWSILTITPSNNPVEELALALTRDLPTASETSAIKEELAADTGNLNLYARKLLQRQNHSQLLLVVDQFEELFTLCEDELIRRAFVENLLRATISESGRMYVVIVLRADFYAQCDQYPILREAVSQNQIYIGAMNGAELRQAIEKPAIKEGWAFDVGLTDIFLRDVGAVENRDPEPGALPLLSHALLETWRRRSRHILTLQGYLAAGGVRGAIAETAETVYQALSDEQKQLTRQIFLRLTGVGDGLYTRRRVYREDIQIHGINKAAVDETLQSLVETRLVTANTETQTERQTIEVAHEALIRVWPRLQEWLEQDREDIRLLHEIENAVRTWNEHNQDPSFLYRGLRLSRIEGWLAETTLSPNEQAQMFINASLAERERQQVEEKKKRQTAEQLKVQRRIGAAIGIFLVIAVALAFFAFNERNQANMARATSVFNEELAVTGEAVANEAKATSEAAEATSEAIAGSESIAREIAVVAEATSVANANLASTREAEALELKDTQESIARSQQLVALSEELSNRTPNLAFLLAIEAAKQAYTTQTFNTLLNSSLTLPLKPPVQIQHPTLTRAKWNQLETQVMTLGEDEFVRIWDSNSNEMLFELTLDNETADASWSPTGTLIATVDKQGIIKLWDALTGKQVGDDYEHGKIGDSLRIEWNSVGTHFFVRSSHFVSLWQVNNGQAAAKSKFNLENANVNEVIWNATGTHFFIRISNVVFVHNLEDFFVITHEDKVVSAQWESSGTRIISASQDKSVQIWDIITQKLTIRFDHDEKVLGALWNDDGSQVLSYSEDGQIYVWNSSDKTLVFHKQYKDADSPSDQLDNSLEVNWSENDKRITAFSRSGIIKTWEVESGELEGVPILQSERILDVKGFGSNRFILVRSGENANNFGLLPNARRPGYITLWDTIDGEQIFRRGFDDAINEIVWSGRSLHSRILVYGKNNSVNIWSRYEGDLLFSMYQDDEIVGAEWSDDEKSILTYSKDGRVMVWSLQDDEYDGFNGGRVAIEDGLWNEDQTLIMYFFESSSHPVVWNSESGFPDEPTPLYVNLTVLGVDWSPDESMFLTNHAKFGGPAGVWVWDTNTNKRLFILPHDDTVSSAYWSSDGKYIITSSRDKFVRIWSVEDIENPQIVQTFEHDKAVFDARWSEDEDRILTVSGDNIVPPTSQVRFGTESGSVQIWDVNDTTEPIIILPHDEVPLFARWNRDERLVVTGAEDNIVRIWDTNLEEPLIREFDIAQPVNQQIAFITGDERQIIIADDTAILGGFWNQDETQLMVRSKNGTVAVWDTVTGNLLFSINHQNSVQYAEWNNDESKVLTFSSDSVRLSDAQNGRELFSLDTNLVSVANVAWSLDNTNILVLTKTRHVYEIPVDLDGLIEIACSKAYRNLSIEEWGQYFPNEPYRTTCDNLPAYTSVSEGS